MSRCDYGTLSATMKKTGVSPMEGENNSNFILKKVPAFYH